MSIRWKLFLTFFLMTAGATAWVLMVAEREFRGWVKDEVGLRFEAEVKVLLDSRAERLASLREASSKMADHEGVVAELRGEGTRESRESVLREFVAVRALGGGKSRAREGGDPQPGGGLRPGGDPRPGGGTRPGAIPGANQRPRDPQGRRPDQGLSQGLPLVGVLKPNGEPFHFGRSVAKPGRARRARVEGRFASISRTPKQEISYMVVPGDGNRRSRIQEVVVTPVRGNDEALLGWFFFGIDAETREERAFQEGELASGRDVRSGLVVDDQWFVRGVSKAEAEEFANAASEEIWMGGAPEVLEVKGAKFLMIAKDLNPESPLGKGYQVAVFPLEHLLAAVAQLRVAVCVLGGCTMLVAMLVAFFLAGRFSKPIAALVEGTERVRSGDLQSVVEVRSRDEFGVLARAFNAMTEDLALKERYREVLSKVSDPTVAQRLVEGDLALGGEVKEAAVLFCDIRGFTSMTEGMDPREVIALVNDHMTAMTKLVYLHGGVVDKFVGDLVMAIFGVPVSHGNDEVRAARCALEMIEERRKLSEESGRLVEVGIGVAYGELVAGCMGSEDRLNYTVLGERVNLASRLCSVAERGEVLVDGSVAGALGDEFRVERREPVALKGFSEPVDVFALSFDRPARLDATKG